MLEIKNTTDVTNVKFEADVWSGSQEQLRKRV